MTYSQAKNKQQQKSDTKNCVQVKFKFTKSTDADILEWLSALDNKQGYIKRLIREDIARHAADLPDRKEIDKIAFASCNMCTHMIL